MKRFTPDTIKYINYLSMPDMHPEGTKTVFVKTSAEEETGSFIPHIYELEHLSGEVRPVVFKASKQKMPQYSPDGRYLAYLSDESGEFQIHIRTEGTLETVKLTSVRHGITYFDWSQDSSTLVFTAPLWKKELEKKQEFTEMQPEEKVNWQAEKDLAPIEITEIDYKNDDCYGMRDGSVTHVGVVTLKDQNQKLLSTGEMECAYPVFSRDKKQIAFFGKPYSGVYASSAELFVYDMEVSEANVSKLKQITKERSLMLLPTVRPLFSALGDSIYVTGYYISENDGFAAETIYDVDLSTGEANLFFDPVDEAVTCGINTLAVGRTVHGDHKPYFAIDYEGGYIYFKNAWFGWENLYRAPVDGYAKQKSRVLGEARKIEPVLVNKLNVHDFCMPRNGRCILLGGDLTTIAELYELDLEAKQFKRMTFSNEWIKEYELAKIEELWVPTKDQKAKLQVWVVHPIGEEPGKRYPVVLDIHGGPECTYVSDFWHEFQSFAEAGFVCVYTNPRGSAGYGMNFMNNNQAYQSEAVEDLLTVLDTVVERGLADPERIGVTGGSYGGYMTLKLIMETKRFRAAAAQRCLANMATSYGTGDMGFISKGSEDSSKIKMLEVLTNRARRSLIRNVDQIKVPLLLLHGYRDYRCSFEQSEQMFIAMKERNPEIPVRLVMFPEENHGITRNGKLHNQIRHLQEMINWFGKYLREVESEDE